MPRLARRADLAAFHAPVLLAAAEHDPLFPPKRVLPAADSGHILSSDAAARLSPRLAAFFSG